MNTGTTTTPRAKIRRFAGIVVLAAALLATVASSENKPGKVDEGGGKPSGPSAPQSFAVGDLIELGDWQIRVHGVTDPFTSDNTMIQPAPGQRYVAVDAEVTNNSDRPQVVSSLMCFELQDGSNVKHNQALAPGGAATPDGEVAAGTSRRGTIVYEVPAAATGLRLHFKCDLFSSGSAVVSLGG